MAMDKDRLGLALAKIVIDNSAKPPTPDMVLKIQSYWTDIAGEIIGEITANAKVAAGIGVSVATSAPGTPSTGATTAPGTIS